MHNLDHISKGTLPCRAEGCSSVVKSMIDGERHAIFEHSVEGVVAIKCKDCPESLPTFRKLLYHHTFKHGELKEYAEEMSSKQKEFLRIKKNQSRKEKKPNESEEKNKIKIDVGAYEVVGSALSSSKYDKEDDDEEELQVDDSENRILDQLQIAMTGTSESNTEIIGNISDVISELFPLAVGEQYQCLHCMMGFTDAILWMTHLGYHDVENPFKCSGCSRKFENRQTFVLHLTYFAHGPDPETPN